MQKMILSGTPPINIVLKRSARARRMSLRVSRLDGRVTLSLPRGLAEREAREFLSDMEDWIRKHLAEQPETVVVAVGCRLAYEGRVLTVVSGAGRVARAEADQLIVPGHEDTAARRVRAFMKFRARINLRQASDEFSAQLGRPCGRLSLRDTRSRWGSCSSEGNLMFSWRLIMAPPDVLRYVAAHEVAHLAEMNHSAAFWRVVAQICPDYAAPRAWLRKNGQTLHRYRFTD
ncbi:MAG: M48 family metallopeptidase [Halocynthiibacter sp.]